MSRGIQPAQSTSLATTGDVIEGLEGVDQSDLTTPVIKINHEQGVFVDSLTNETFTEFDAIILGLVKQRILWPPTPGASGESPMCRSYDHRIGNPDPAKWVTKHNGITAVSQSGFTFDEVEAGGLDCNSCKLKEWESHPNNSTPWCSEQFTLPVIRILPDGSQQAAIIAFQKTGLKPCKSYISGFVAAKRPLYTAVTRVTANHQRKGSVDFVTPSFARISDSDPSEHPQYSRQLNDIRTFISTPRTRNTEDDVPVSVTPSQPTDAEPAPAQRAQAAPEPTPAAAPVIDVDDEEEPF